jgi:hypothetical protein
MARMLPSKCSLRSEPKNPRFEPPRSRWAGTAVQKWPPWYCRELRTELLRVRAVEAITV